MSEETSKARQIIHLFRHAQAQHNATGDNTIPDPPLTELGITQSFAILREYPFFTRPTLILVSPFRRAIETTLYAFHPAKNPDAAKLFSDRPPTIIALPQLQEISDENPCDRGSPIEDLKVEFGDYVIFNDSYFSPSDWPIKKDNAYVMDNELLAKRARWVREYSQVQEDTEIIVITHNDFSCFLVNRWLYGPGCGSLWDGLGNACGKPMVIREMEVMHAERERDTVMMIEIP